MRFELSGDDALAAGPRARRAATCGASGADHDPRNGSAPVPTSEQHGPTPGTLLRSWARKFAAAHPNGQLWGSSWLCHAPGFESVQIAPASGGCASTGRLSGLRARLGPARLASTNELISNGWTQADPLYRFLPDSAWTNPRRANLHTFSLHNALRYIDPTGLDSMDGYRPGSDCTSGAQRTDCMHKEVYGGESPYGRNPTPSGGSERSRSADEMVVSRLNGLYGGKLKVGRAEVFPDLQQAKLLTGPALVDFFKKFVAPLLDTRSGREQIAHVAHQDNSDVIVLIGGHGENVKQRYDKTFVLWIDESAASQRVDGVRGHPDLLLFHEVLHALRPTLAEEQVRQLENIYRGQHSPPIKDRRIYD